MIPSSEDASTSPAVPPAGASNDGLRGWVLNYWRPVALVLLCLDIPIIALGRVDLPGGVSFGLTSFTRNIAIFLLLGTLLGASGLPRPKSQLMLSFVAFFLCAWLSTFLGGGVWGAVRWLGFSLIFFYGVRSLSASTGGRQFLFHWLGALAIASVLGEIWLNPDVLAFDQSRRTEMATGHPNIIAGFFALVAPVFFAGNGKDRWWRGMAPIYLLFAVFGVLMTFSRLSFAGLGIGIVAVALARWYRRFPGRVGLLGAGGILLAGLFVLYLSQGRMEADVGRLRIFQTSFSIFSEHWLWGVGWGGGNLKLFFVDRYESLFGTAMWSYHSHNMYLEILVGMGVIGAAVAALVLWSLLSLVRQAWSLLDVNLSRDRFALGLMSALPVFLWLGLGDVPIYHSRILFPLVVLWALLEGWVEQRRAGRA